MARISVEDLLERTVTGLKEKESEKKKELQVIQVELRKNQKALEVLSGISPNTNKKPKRDV